MLEETYDFYSPSNFDIKDLDKGLQNSLTVMNSLDDFTRRHSENVSNLCTRICQKTGEHQQFSIHCMIARIYT